jgi:predicted Zn-ribbon and HTH transcriptional regulator
MARLSGSAIDGYDAFAMTTRRHILDLLTSEPRSVSSLARELGLKRGDAEEELRHVIRSARAAGHQIVIEPARCRTCGFVFGEEKLSKPGKCPSCRGTRLLEAQVRVDSQQ